MVESVVAHGNTVWASHKGAVVKLNADLELLAEHKDAGVRVAGVGGDGELVVAISETEKQVLVLNGTQLAEVVATHDFPKRPSAVDVRGNELVVADKFGDVFHRPLTTSSDDKSKPILGHISMVLDVVLPTADAIITSDRDEHIRVSRFPQSFVIDAFLLAHKSFVSHLATTGDYLVSGGGDSFVLLWNWRSGKLLSRLETSGNTIALAIREAASRERVLYVAVEGSSKVISAEIKDDELVRATEFDLESPVQSLAVLHETCYAALPNALVQLDGSARYKFDSSSELVSEQHLLKRA